ncbi:hypothetical protein O3M35_003550 [Rhynocoris fuscipes]|uniref:Type VII secretion system protein EssD-like domain-containing protein n=1 Tax=Rhynocoris fuscipes TaxID=488301 RepID=A0AAW1CNC3_9HEMI
METSPFWLQSKAQVVWKWVDAEKREKCDLPLPVVECIKENGKVIYIKAILREKNLRNNDGEISTNVKDEMEKIKAKGDDAAHLIANHLGGTGKYIENFVPFDAHSNRGKMRHMEENVYKLVKKSKVPITYEVWVQWNKDYSPNRPASITYKVTSPNQKDPIIKTTFVNSFYKGPVERNPDEQNPDTGHQSDPELTLCKLPEPVVECRKKDGKVVYIKAILREKNLRNNDGEISTNVKDEMEKIKAKGDDAAHLIANHLGGTGKYIENFVPFDAHSNRGKMRDMEENVYKLVKKSKVPITYEVWVQWNKDYSPNRPASITYKVTSPNQKDPIIKTTFVNSFYKGPVERNPDEQNPDTGHQSDPELTLCKLPEPVVECRKKDGKVVYIKAILREKNLRNNDGEISTKIKDEMEKIKAKGDDAARLIAGHLGGTGKYIENFVPLDANLNRGEMKEMVQNVYKLVKESKEPIIYEVWVQWNKEYSPNRPVSITYKVSSLNHPDPILKTTFVDPFYKGPVERNPDEKDISLEPDNPGTEDHPKPDKEGEDKKGERENPKEHPGKQQHSKGSSRSRSRYCPHKRPRA